MSNQPDGGPAFPCPQDSINQNAPSLGMTLRDYFAAKAMQSELMFPDHHEEQGSKWADGVAQTAYTVADAMLKYREEYPC